MQSREGAVRRALMEHQAGVLAWEVRRLEHTNQMAEAQATRYQKEAEEVKALRLVAQQAAEQKAELAESQGRIKQLESMVADLGSREGRLLSQIESTESEKSRLRKDRDLANQQVDALRRENKTLSTTAETWSQAKSLLANALERPHLEDPSEMAEWIQKLVSSIKHKDEELRIIKEEMREVNTGMERELSRVAADRDTYKARLDEADRGMTQERSVAQKLGQMEEREKVSWSQVLATDETDHVLVQRLTETVKHLESENAQMHAALATAENQAWSRAATVSNGDTKRLEALRREMDANDVIIEDLWTILPTPASRRATGLIDVVSDKIKPSVVSPATECKPEALRALCEPAPALQREDYAGVQETARRVRTLIEDSRAIFERAIQAGKERELFKSNTARAQRLIEESQSSLATYQR
jgi:uncharacterized phage infection (PIP) family protein YhgE